MTQNPGESSSPSMESSGEPQQTLLAEITDPLLSLHNLSKTRSRIDTVQRFLSDSVNRNVRISDHQMAVVSSEIAVAIHHIIADGTALLASGKSPDPPASASRPDPTGLDLDYDVVELDAMEILAEHIHLCEICGKGFKRDANLRMHMRAHGNRFKSPDALAKPVDMAGEGPRGKGTRFSCPYEGCKRNKKHKKFRALKSVVCVKNHFKRSHCPKMFSCNRCNEKSFSVVADLKSHLKHCGESKWRCTCGTTFSRKDKLFGHVTLFEGHAPAPADMGDDGDGEGDFKVVESAAGSGGSDDGFLESFLDGFGSVENRCLQEVLGFCNDLDSDWKYL